MDPKTTVRYVCCMSPPPPHTADGYMSYVCLPGFPSGLERCMPFQGEGDVCGSKGNL